MVRRHVYSPCHDAVSHPLSLTRHICCPRTVYTLSRFLQWERQKDLLCSRHLYPTQCLVRLLLALIPEESEAKTAVVVAPGILSNLQTKRSRRCDKQWSRTTQWFHATARISRLVQRGLRGTWISLLAETPSCLRERTQHQCSLAFTERGRVAPQRSSNPRTPFSSVSAQQRTKAMLVARPQLVQSVGFASESW